MVYLKIFLELCAATIVFIEQIRSKEKYRKVLLSLATILIIGSAIFTYLDFHFGKKSEIERKADLLTIQKLSSSLNDLAFEFDLKNIDSSYVFPIHVQIATSVNTSRAWSGMFADYLQIGFKADSGWYVIFSTYQRYRVINFKCSHDTVRFILPYYGLSAEWNKDKEIKRDQIYNRNGWEPTTIADLGRLNIGFSVNPLYEFDYFYNSKREWCPIDKIKVYANSFDEDNLLFSAERNVKYNLPDDTPFLYFFPRYSKFYGNPDGREFLIEPFHIRDAILNSLNQ